MPIKYIYMNKLKNLVISDDKDWVLGQFASLLIELSEKEDNMIELEDNLKSIYYDDELDYYESARICKLIIYYYSIHVQKLSFLAIQNTNSYLEILWKKNYCTTKDIPCHIFITNEHFLSWITLHRAYVMCSKLRKDNV